MAIADELRGRLDAGEFGAGQLLPSEADLAATHGASRVTVRRALEELRSEGRIDSRQGFGWFAAADPVPQSLGRLGTLEDQLAARGLESERRVLDFGFVEAPPRARRVLGVDTVLRVRRLNLADGAPFARVTVWCPEHLGAPLSRQDVESSPFVDLLEIDFGHATQSIGAVAAGADDAEHLGIPTGSPMLRCERVTHDRDGAPILLSEFVFPGHLTEFVVDLQRPAASIAPSGLRLVEGEGA